MKLVANTALWVDGEAVEAGEVFEIHDQNQVKRLLGDGGCYAVDNEFAEGEEITVRKGSKK